MLQQPHLQFTQNLSEHYTFVSVFYLLFWCSVEMGLIGRAIGLFDYILNVKTTYRLPARQAFSLGR